MKSFIISVCVVLFLVGCGANTPGIPKRPESLGLDEVEFSPVKPLRWELENGLVVMYRFDDEIPMVGGKLYLPGGELFVSEDSAGLASATGAQMREGGIQGMGPEALDKKLDDLAASVESGFGDEYGTSGFSCLAEDFDEVFELFSEVTLRPAFNSRRLELHKRLVAHGISRRRDNPSTMAGMAFQEAVYGKGSPYARSVSLESIKTITRKKMQAFHRKFVRPNGSILAIAGAVPVEQVREAVKERFGDWEANPEALPPYPLVKTDPARVGLYVLERDFEQATVVLGHTGPPRFPPDFHAMLIFNRLFGHSGFESLLFNEIRTRQGLAYSVYGGLYPGPVAGVFQIGAGTRVGEVARAINSILKTIDQAREEPPSEEKLEHAQIAVRRGFVFKFASTGAIINRAAMLEMLEYPKDYDETYLEMISDVNSQDTVAVAQRWIRPHELSIVVVGKVKAKELAKAFGDRMKVFLLDFDYEPKVLGEVKPN